MAVTTLAAFVADVAAASIANVETKLAYPPDAVEDAMLPLSYTQFPQGDELPITFDGGGGWPDLSIELVYVVAPLGKADAEQRFDEVIAAADELRAALSTLDTTKSKLTWSIQTDITIEIGGRKFLGAAALVTGRG